MTALQNWFSKGLYKTSDILDSFLSKTEDSVFQIYSSFILSDGTVEWAHVSGIYVEAGL
jgi:hypothetical protein